MHSALILAGGSGTRFWPLSRRSRPKQFLTLDSERSLLQATVDRLAPLIPPGRIWISTTAAMVDEVRRQLPEVAPERIVVEPTPKNTAPAIGLSIARMSAEARAGAIAVLPSDHRIADPVSFRVTLGEALTLAAAQDRFVVLGVVPRRADTGFGYLELGVELAGSKGLCRVESFREKPDRANAESFVASGRYLWNAGMFVFRGERFLAELARLAPELGTGLAAIAAEPDRIEELYSKLPSISVDYAVIERLEELVSLPLDCGWDDLGSWQALFDVLPVGERGNRQLGSTLAVDANGNLLVAESGTVAVLGVEGLAVVQTRDAVLVLPLERAQEVRRLVEQLEATSRDELC